MMSSALRLRQPRLALRLADSLVADGAKADAQVCTLLVKAHAACGQRAEALAILPRMLAEQVAGYTPSHAPSRPPLTPPLTPSHPTLTPPSPRPPLAGAPVGADLQHPHVGLRARLRP